MYNGGKIMLGLLIFLAVVTFPFWYNLGTADTIPKPKIETPFIKQHGIKKCVESKDYMRREHMQLLDTWRNDAVRKGERIYVNSEGKRYLIDLQNTCLKCHSNKKDFCDKCHNYMAVKPYCWDCHFAPKENKS
ncbi:MAG: sulfate reduction electron transfer complex DsrMKJOP subunit DsrJ [Candidatus Sulfobium sp.]|jgi:hypothetical protein